MTTTFKEQKELLKIERKNQIEKHMHHMEELELQKKLEKVKFDCQLQLQRIKSAEIRKSIERQGDLKFMRKLGEER